MFTLWLDTIFAVYCCDGRLPYCLAFFFLFFFNVILYSLSSPMPACFYLYVFKFDTFIGTVDSCKSINHNQIPHLISGFHLFLIFLFSCFLKKYIHIFLFADSVWCIYKKCNCKNACKINIFILYVQTSLRLALF